MSKSILCHIYHTYNNQLSTIFRNVTEDGLSVTRFLCFMKNARHTEGMFSEAVLNSLELHGLQLDICSCQSHKTAANMAGIYSV